MSPIFFVVGTIINSREDEAMTVMDVLPSLIKLSVKCSYFFATVLGVSFQRKQLLRRRLLALRYRNKRQLLG